MKERIKRILPKQHQLKQYKSLNVFGEMLHHPNLWRFNRNSIALAFAVGLFFAWVPVPFQMALAAGVALIVHSNLPISMALVWITNPVTMPPLYYFAYKVGAKLLHIPTQKFKFELSFEWLFSTLKDIWKPFLFGCGVIGIFSAVIGYFAVHALWRYSVARNWRLRQVKRIKAAELD